MEPDCFNCITVAVVSLRCWAVLHAVVPIPNVLEEVDLQQS